MCARVVDDHLHDVRELNYYALSLEWWQRTGEVVGIENVARCLVHARYLAVLVYGSKSDELAAYVRCGSLRGSMSARKLNLRYGVGPEYGFGQEKHHANKRAIK